jgi:uncharacterized protein (TIGR03032 family)
LVEPAAPATGTGLALELLASRQFPAWLAEQRLSLAFTTYQAGKLFLVGLRPDGRLAVVERTFNRAMGLCVHDRQLYLATLYQLWRFDDALEPGQAHHDHDRLYVPQLAWTTGDLDVHDLAVDGQGRVVFVNTLFSCLAEPSPGYSFAPLWQPPWITRLAAEDRCHLNGLALVAGRPGFATAVSRGDAAEGWRDRRRDGGVVARVPDGEVVLDGLSMPHSPRWHDGRLWLLDSGRGWLGHLDADRGAFERVAFCPGYARGLALHGSFAVVGLSKPRGNRTFGGLELDEALRARDAEARCGLLVVDLRTGDAVHSLRIEGVVEELYDVAVLPGARRPTALGLKTDEIRRTLSLAPPAPL